jgi:hypothetical protein
MARVCPGGGGGSGATAADAEVVSVGVTVVAASLMLTPAARTIKAVSARRQHVRDVEGTLRCDLSKPLASTRAVETSRRLRVLVIIS